MSENIFLSTALLLQTSEQEKSDPFLPWKLQKNFSETNHPRNTPTKKRDKLYGVKNRYIYKVIVAGRVAFVRGAKFQRNLYTQAKYLL